MIDLKEYASTLRDPLCATTRNAKKNMLLFSILGLLITKVNFIPKKIALLGVDLSGIDSKALTLILLVATLFYLTTFIIYLITEVKSWRILSVNNIINQFVEDLHSQEKINENLFTKIGSAVAINQQNHKEELKVRKLLYFRIFTETILPIIFSLYAILLLLNSCFDGHLVIHLQKIYSYIINNNYQDSNNLRLAFAKFMHSCFFVFLITIFFIGVSKGGIGLSKGHLSMFFIFTLISGIIGLFLPK